MLPHTADAGFEVWGPRIEDVYEQAVLALFALMGPRPSLSPAESFEIDAAGVDREDLLVRVLTECVGRFELDGLFVTAATSDGLRRDGDGDVVTTLRCEGGTLVDRERCGLEEVKAVTYHGLEVREDAAGFRGRVYVDL